MPLFNLFQDADTLIPSFYSLATRKPQYYIHIMSPRYALPDQSSHQSDLNQSSMAGSSTTTGSQREQTFDNGSTHLSELTTNTAVALPKLNYIMSDNGLAVVAVYPNQVFAEIMCDLCKGIELETSIQTRGGTYFGQQGFFATFESVLESFTTYDFWKTDDMRTQLEQLAEHLVNDVGLFRYHDLSVPKTYSARFDLVMATLRLAFEGMDTQEVHERWERLHERAGFDQDSMHSSDEE